MLVVFGLNKDIWNQLGTSERALYTWAARLYLLSCLLSAAAGMRFMQQLSDSYVIGVLGGLLVGYIVSVVTRIALITMVSLPIHPEVISNTITHPSSTQPAQSLVNYAIKLKQLGTKLPDFSILFRLVIIAMMALTTAMPVAALLGYTQAENFSALRRSQVLNDFKAHPSASTGGEQDKKLAADVANDHFPIYVYQQLASEPIGIFSVWFTGACFLIPFFMLWHLRRGKQFQYATLNREILVKQIETDYAMTLEQSRRMQQGRFGLSECILPNTAWLDAPFNTRSIAEQSTYTLETEAAFIERLKTL